MWRREASEPTMMNTRLFFTGTREGMTLAQLNVVERLLTTYRTEYDTFHHGDCIGADAEAFLIAHCLGYRTEAHPSTVPGTQARTPSTVTHPPKPPLSRNNDLALIGHVGIAAPHSLERLRSGTWACVRCGRARGKMILIIWPDGKLTIT